MPSGNNDTTKQPKSGNNGHRPDLQAVEVEDETAAYWPQDPEAEAAVLCSIFLSAEDPRGNGRNIALGTVADRERLQPKHFRTLLGEQVYKADLEIRQRGYLPDPMTVGGVLSEWGKLDEIGGQYAINRLTDVVQVSENAGLYAQRVRVAWCKREILRLAALETANVHNPAKLAEIQAERAEVLAEMQPKRSTRLLTDIEAEQMQPSPAIIPRLLYANGITMLYGDSDAYKTFLALSMALSIQTGSAWFGRHVEGGQVVYVAGEAPNGIGKRLTAWKMQHGITDSTGFRLWTDPVNLMDPTDVNVFISEVRAELGETMPTLVVFDTLAVCMGAGDPNKDDAINAAYIGMRRVRDAFDGAAVLVIDHEGKDASRGMSGSSKKRNNADGVIYVVRDGECSPTITVKPTKCKDAKLPDPFRLTAEERHWSTEDGEPRSSLVLVDAGDAPAVTAPARLSPRRAEALTVLAKHYADNGEGLTRTDWIAACVAAGMSKNTADEAVDTLRKYGHVQEADTLRHLIPTDADDQTGVKGKGKGNLGVIPGGAWGVNKGKNPIGVYPLPRTLTPDANHGVETQNTGHVEPGYTPQSDVEQTYGKPERVMVPPSPGKPTPTSNGSVVVTVSDCRVVRPDDIPGRAYAIAQLARGMREDDPTLTKADALQRAQAELDAIPS